MPRPRPNLGTPIAIVAITLLALWACAGWQARGLAPSQPPSLRMDAPGTLDGGVALPAREDEATGSEAIHSQAIVTRELTPGMLDMPDDAPPRVPRCEAPRTQVQASEACADGAPYPECRWRLPEPEDAGHAHQRWRNTRPEHWWARPALVSIVLATAHGYADKFPGERLVVGDLDAAGPRHTTHDRGVDVDLYLPGDMESDNAGAGEYPSNYENRPHLATRMRRARVQALARILSSCTGGSLRIYYNDRPVAESFTEWFRRAGFASPFGRPMQAHNDLHRFHFHVTIDEALAPLPGVTPVMKSARPSRRGLTARNAAPTQPPRREDPPPAIGGRRTDDRARPRLR